MVWDGEDRRSGKDQRQAERRGDSSQKVTKLANGSNRRKQARRSADRLATPVAPPTENKWRELRLRTVGTPPAQSLPPEKPVFRLINGGENDDSKP